MAGGANVRSIDTLEHARFVLTEYRETAKLAISEAIADVDRTTHWVATDLRMQWKQELVKRKRKLERVLADLSRAEISASGSLQSTRAQRGAVERVRMSIEEAEVKLRAIASWKTRLERESNIFKGLMQQLGRFVEADLVKGIAQLELFARRLEAYVNETPIEAVAGPPKDADDDDAVGLNGGQDDGPDKEGNAP